MRMDVERPRCARDPLVDAIALFLARDHAQGLGEIRIMLEQAIDEAGPGAVDRLGSRLASAGEDWDYTPSDPLARRIHRVLASRVLQHEPVVTGLGHLESVRGKPLVIFANHLSYSDANAVEVLLQRAGASEVADRLTVIAGPKVYSNVRRRFSSLCFGTIKVPQSTTRASDEAVMSARDVATAAKQSIQTAHERVRLGRGAARLSGRLPQQVWTNAALTARRRTVLGATGYVGGAHGPHRHGPPLSAERGLAEPRAPDAAHRDATRRRGARTYRPAAIASG